MCVLKRVDGHVLRWALDFEVDGHRRKAGSNRTSKMYLGRMCES